MDTVQFYIGEDGDFWWRMKSPNGKIIGGSTEGYRRKKTMKKNYKRVTGEDSKHIVIDLTKSKYARQD